jgi:hypothetical protein
MGMERIDQQFILSIISFGNGPLEEQIYNINPMQQTHRKQRI